MSVSKTYTAKEAYEDFVQDRDCDKFQDFLKESRLARLVMEDKFRMDDLGFQQDDKPFVKWNTIRRSVNFIYAKISGNSPKAIAAPYEGFNTEENTSKICDAIWKFESAQERTHQELNFGRENKKAGYDGLVEGCGYGDSRIDDATADTMFPIGLPVYEAPKPVNVIIDRAAGRWEEKDRIHIVHWVSPDKVEIEFGKDIATLKYESDELGEDPEKHLNKIRIIETQYKAFESNKLYRLTPEQQMELGIENPYVWETELREHLKQLKLQYPEEYPYLDINVYLQNTEFVRNPTKYGWFAIFHIDGKALHKEPFFLVQQCTLNQFCPFPADNSPYGHGIPYFLLDQAKAEMLFGTQAIRAAMSRHFYTKTEPTPEFKDQFNKNKLIDIFNLSGMVDPDEDINKQIIDKDHLDKLPYLIQFWRILRSEEEGEFKTDDPNVGGSPPSGTSGKLMGRLMAAAMTLLIVIVDDYHWFLRRQFNRSLRLAIETIPVPVLLFIAGENDEERYKLITSGDFKKRISLLNAQVTLDLRTEEEKLIQKQIVGKLLEVDRFPWGKGFEILGIEEPYELEKQMKKWEMERQPMMAMAKELSEDKVFRLIAQNYFKHRDVKAAAKQIEAG